MQLSKEQRDHIILAFNPKRISDSLNNKNFRKAHGNVKQPAQLGCLKDILLGFDTHACFALRDKQDSAEMQVLIDTWNQLKAPWLMKKAEEKARHEQRQAELLKQRLEEKARQREAFVASLKTLPQSLTSWSKILKMPEFARLIDLPPTFNSLCILLDLDPAIATDYTARLEEKARVQKEKVELRKAEKKKHAEQEALLHLKAMATLDKVKACDIYLSPLTRKVLGDYVSMSTLLETWGYAKTTPGFQEVVDYTVKVKQLVSCYGNPIQGRHLPAILKISNTEYAKWKGKRIPIHEMRGFRKWGKNLEAPYYSVHDLVAITEQDIEMWRLLDSGQKIRSVSDLDAWNAVLSTLSEFDIYYDKKWFKIIRVFLKEGLHSVFVRRNIEHPATPAALKDYPSLIDELKEKAGKWSPAVEKAKVLKKMDEYELTEQEFDACATKLHYRYGTTLPKNIKDTTFGKFLTEALTPVIKDRQDKKVREYLEVAHYDQAFPLARSLNRQITLITGPTNSGKTWEAIDALANAESGVYLAPLRLLALEIYDKLRERGVPCNLLTGEEKIIDPLARHSACTVEMMNPDVPVDIAVIDEFQMVYDGQRGWAWTASMVGVPAKKVFIVGSSVALPYARKLFTYLNEEFVVISKSRLAPLSLIPGLTPEKALKKGDAVIAFSRRDVLSFASVLKGKGFKVSAIYGALSPEVRKKQAKMFLDGETDIVVSTDAIGMGLNLPISRLFFATMEKYDGVCVRDLDVTEITQIAGRAGRYGHHESGGVGILKTQASKPGWVSLLSRTLHATPHGINARLPIAPTGHQVLMLGDILKTKKLDVILMYYQEIGVKAKLAGEPLFAPADFEDMVSRYLAISDLVSKYDLDTQFKFCQAPVNANEEGVMDYYRDMLFGFGRGVCRFGYPRFLKSAVNPYMLEEAETLNKCLSVFVWLAYHFPEDFNIEGVAEIREKLSSYISEALMRTKMVDFTPAILGRPVYRDDWY